MALGVVGDLVLIREGVQHQQAGIRAGLAQQWHGLAQDGEGLLPGDGAGGGIAPVPGARGQARALGPGQGGVVIVALAHIGKSAAGGHGGAAHGVIQHEHKVSPADLIVPAKQVGGHAAHDALFIAVFHRVIGPVALWHVGVQVAHRHLDGLGLAPGGDGDGPAAAALSGGEQAVFVHRADVTGDGDRRALPAAQGGAAPIAAGDGQLHTVPRLDGHRGQGVGAALFRHGEHRETGDDVQLRRPRHAQAGRGELEPLHAALAPGGVYAIGDGPQAAARGDGDVGHVGIGHVQPLVQGHRPGEGELRAGEHGLPLLLQGQACGDAVPLLVGHQQQIGGTAAGPPVRGDVLDGDGALARIPHGDGGGTAPVQIHHPLAALVPHLFGQVLLAQADGIAALAAVHGVHQQSAVCLHAQGGAGGPAILHIVPLAAVGEGAVFHHDIPHAPGPLGVGQGLVVTAGPQGDLVPHGKGLIVEQIAGGVIGGEDILVLPDVQGIAGLEHLRHLKGQVGVQGQLGPLAAVHQLHAHIPAGGRGAGGHGGEVPVH